jgi:hypothetical protein
MGSMETAEALSPNLVVAEDMLPTVILFGTEDAILAEGITFVERAKELGFDAMLYTADKMGHGFFNREPWRARTLYLAERFMMEHGHIDGPPTLSVPDETEMLEISPDNMDDPQIKEVIARVKDKFRWGHYWFAWGSHRKDYETGGDPTAEHGAENCGFIRSKETEIDGSGTWMTMIKPDDSLGERIRMSGYVKTKDVDGWAGLWMHVDAVDTTLAVDDMRNRPIKGTTDWERYEVVLDVPQNSVGIFYGIMLTGTGQAWVDNVKLEIVGRDVLPTGLDAAPAK